MTLSPRKKMHQPKDYQPKAARAFSHRYMLSGIVGAAVSAVLLFNGELNKESGLHNDLKSNLVASELVGSVNLITTAVGLNLSVKMQRQRQDQAERGSGSADSGHESGGEGPEHERRLQQNEGQEAEEEVQQEGGVVNTVLAALRSATNAVANAMPSINRDDTCIICLGHFATISRREDALVEGEAEEEFGWNLLLDMITPSSRQVFQLTKKLDDNGNLIFKILMFCNCIHDTI
jgi:hypothetical protein